MKGIIIYYLIGMIVSTYHIWYYRFSKNRIRSKATDGLGALWGVWFWPIQLFFHLKHKYNQ